MGYVISTLIGFSIFLFLFTMSKFLSEVWNQLVREIFTIVPIFFLIGCIYLFVVWFILTYSWEEIGEVSEPFRRNILRGSIILSFLFIVIWLSPSWKDIIINERIHRAEYILSTKWETRDSLKEAQDIWLLDWSFKEKYLDNNLYGEEKNLYTKIFDTSIESAIEGAVDTEEYRARNSNATSQLARAENAKVTLNFAKYDSEVLSDLSAVKTTVTYEFQNTALTNQEVIFSVVLPNTASVMSDLRLGLNLEFTGVIAPRGSASKVYQDSLRRNTDPALLEQTWPVSYRLRVFPVPSLNDAKSQGRQQVQFTYISPLTESGTITLVPKTDILNLKLTEKSQILTRLTEWEKALAQDSYTGNDMTVLTVGKSIKSPVNLTKTYTDYCRVNSYPHIDLSKVETWVKSLSKNIVFFDISKSVGETPNTKKRYQMIIDTWKANGVSLDLFTYNFEVYPSGYNLDNIDFWGSTDMSKIIDYIDKNNISNANIVIVTDDSSYERMNDEIKSIDYKKLKSNRISLIQVGEKVRTLKTEITKSILATDWAMIITSEKWDLSETVKNIFTEKKLIEKCEDYTGSSLSALQALQGYEDIKQVAGETYYYSWEVSNLKDEKYSRYIGIKPSFRAIYDNDTYEGKTNFWEPFLSELKLKSIPEWYVNTLSQQSWLPHSTSIAWATKEGGWTISWTNGTQIFIDIPSNTVHWQLWVDNNLAKEVVKVFTQEDIDDLWKKSLYNTRFETVKESDLQMQEEIAQATHIVSQATSLIALVNDQQRADLEQYSQHEDKYDTDYENLSPDTSGGFGWGPTVMRKWSALEMSSPESLGFDDVRASPQSVWSDMSTVSKVSRWSPEWILPYILVVILFPLIAWFVLRRKPTVQQDRK